VVPSSAKPLFFRFCSLRLSSNDRFTRYPNHFRHHLPQGGSRQIGRDLARAGTAAIVRPLPRRVPPPGRLGQSASSAHGPRARLISRSYKSPVVNVRISRMWTVERLDHGLPVGRLAPAGSAFPARRRYQRRRGKSRSVRPSSVTRLPRAHFPPRWRRQRVPGQRRAFDPHRELARPTAPAASPLPRRLDRLGGRRYTCGGTTRTAPWPQAPSCPKRCGHHRGGHIEIAQPCRGHIGDAPSSAISR
jgi:hypothetical protein